MAKNTMSSEAGWALTETICEIIDDEIAHSADRTWQFDRVARKVVERLGPETAANIDEYQAIQDALFGWPVGTNVREDGSSPD